MSTLLKSSLVQASSSSNPHFGAQSASKSSAQAAIQQSVTASQDHFSVSQARFGSDAAATSQPPASSDAQSKAEQPKAEQPQAEEAPWYTSPRRWTGVAGIGGIGLSVLAFVSIIGALPGVIFAGIGIPAALWGFAGKPGDDNASATNANDSTAASTPAAPAVDPAKAEAPVDPKQEAVLKQTTQQAVPGEDSDAIKQFETKLTDYVNGYRLMTKQGLEEREIAAKLKINENELQVIANISKSLLEATAEEKKSFIQGIMDLARPLFGDLIPKSEKDKAAEDARNAAKQELEAEINKLKDLVNGTANAFNQIGDMAKKQAEQINAALNPQTPAEAKTHVEAPAQPEAAQPAASTPQSKPVTEQPVVAPASSAPTPAAEEAPKATSPAKTPAKAAANQNSMTPVEAQLNGFALLLAVGLGASGEALRNAYNELFGPGGTGTGVNSQSAAQPAAVSKDDGKVPAAQAAKAPETPESAPVNTEKASRIRERWAALKEALKTNNSTAVSIQDLSRVMAEGGTREGRGDFQHEFRKRLSELHEQFDGIEINVGVDTQIPIPVMDQIIERFIALDAEQHLQTKIDNGSYTIKLKPEQGFEGRYGGEGHPGYTPGLGYSKDGEEIPNKA